MDIRAQTAQLIRRMSIYTKQPLSPVPCHREPVLNRAIVKQVKDTRTKMIYACNYMQDSLDWNRTPNYAPR